jgi:hypothetical protein
MSVLVIVAIRKFFKRAWKNCRNFLINVDNVTNFK